MPASVASPHAEALAPLGEALRETLAALLEAIPDVEQRPTPLAQALGVNRVIVSKLLNAMKRSDPLEVLQQVPGPDSLRAITGAASQIPGVRVAAVSRANDCIDRFAELIREHFRTRGALNAAISDDSEAVRKRYEESARYDIYNGMRHLMGVEGETWLTAMIFAPGADDEALSITTLHGVLGMRRLRPDTPVRFTFGAPYRAPGAEPDPQTSPIALQEYYTNDPAPLESVAHDGMLVHQLATNRIGRNATLDMLAVSHAPHGSSRYAAPQRRFGGTAIFHDVPVRVLHIDALVHSSVFPGVHPHLFVYNPGARGPANPNDPARDIDRVESDGAIEMIAPDSPDFDAPGIPHYREMVARVFDDLSEPPGDYRAFRARIAYPVQGFQYVVAFEAPPRP